MCISRAVIACIYEAPIHTVQWVSNVNRLKRFFTAAYLPLHSRSLRTLAVIMYINFVLNVHTVMGVVRLHCVLCHKKLS